jgi:hypothetical protein
VRWIEQKWRTRRCKWRRAPQDEEGEARNSLSSIVIGLDREGSANASRRIEAVSNQLALSWESRKSPIDLTALSSTGEQRVSPYNKEWPVAP